ncbi:unnamed protein product [Microthlaspi erraticum]|uniref:Uncharacterized protein n=1 Tax=Microthlaspi erraticum TaxID=1685480 RepID=A0A6D2HT59_9BRAS|nr:unnamed protein product [Microthlaspi erraticum]
MTSNNDANGINASGQINEALANKMNPVLIRIQQNLDNIGSMLHHMTSSMSILDDMSSMLRDITSSIQIAKITADTENLSLDSSHERCPPTPTSRSEST